MPHAQCIWEKGGTKPTCGAAVIGEVKYVRATTLYTSRLVGKEGDKVLGYQSTDSLLPMEVRGRADIHLKPMKDPSLKLARGGPCDMWEAHSGASSWQKIWPHGWPMLEQSVSKGLHPVENFHAGAICEELQSVERNYIGEVNGRLSPMRGIPCWSTGRVWRALIQERKKRQRQYVMNWSQPPFMCVCWGGRWKVEKTGSKDEHRKKGGLEERSF